MRNNPCIIFGLPLISLTYQHDTGRNDYTADSFHIWVIWIYTPFYVDVSLQRVMTVMKRCKWQHMSVWFNMTIQLFHFISSIYFNLIFVDYIIFGCFVYFWDVFYFSFVRATRPIPPWRSWAESRRLRPRVFEIWSQKMNKTIYMTATSFFLFCV